MSKSLKLEYSSEVDIMYVRFAEGAVAETIELDPGTLVDLDYNGAALGVEVIRPARPWPIEEVIDRYVKNEDTARLARRLFLPNDDRNVYPYTRPLQLA